MPKTKKRSSLYTHEFDECELSSEYQDLCQECGELTACTCLASIVQEWEIAATGSEGALAFHYEYREKGKLIAYFGYASTYREAMDRIAHNVLCKKVSA